MLKFSVKCCLWLRQSCPPPPPAPDHLHMLCMHLATFRRPNDFLCLGGGGVSKNKLKRVLLLLDIVGQGPAVLAADAERVGYFFFFFFYIFHLSSNSNVLPFGRRLNMTEIF